MTQILKKRQIITFCWTRGTTEMAIFHLIKGHNSEITKGIISRWVCGQKQ